MAATTHKLLREIQPGVDFSSDNLLMHIKCFCHKIALVVNAGLKELGIFNPLPPKIKAKFLGTFPYSNSLETILEEDEDEDNEKAIESGSDNDLEEEDLDENIAKEPDADKDEESSSSSDSDEDEEKLKRREMGKHYLKIKAA